MDGGRILAIEKNSLPQLEIYEEPEPVGVLRDRSEADREARNAFSRAVEDPLVQQRIKDIVASLIVP